MYDINGAGAVTGTYIDINTVNHAFIRNADGSMILIDVPEAGTLKYQGTHGASISPTGIVTGFYEDANDVTHG